jgi:hypothetical protein
MSAPVISTHNADVAAIIAAAQTRPGREAQVLAAEARNWLLWLESTTHEDHEGDLGSAYAARRSAGIVAALAEQLPHSADLVAMVDQAAARTRALVCQLALVS